MSSARRAGAALRDLERRSRRWAACVLPDEAAWLGAMAVTFLAVGAADGFLGPHPQRLLRAAASSGALVLLLVTAATWRRGKGWRSFAWSAAGLLLLLVAASPATVTAALGLLVLGASENATSPRLASRLSGLAGAVLLFSLIERFRLDRPVDAAFEAIAGLVSRAAAVRAGTALDLGPSAVGAEGAVLALLIVMSLASRAALVRGLVAATGALVAIGLALVVHAAMVADWSAARPPSNVAFEEPPVALGRLWILWTLLPVIVACAGAIAVPRPSTGRQRRFTDVAGACAIAGLLVLAVLPMRALHATPSVVVVATDSDRGPAARGYLEREGMTCFERLLRDCGAEVTRVAGSSLVREQLDRANLFVYCVPHVPRPEDVPALRERIRAGAAVLIITDHTSPPDRLAELNGFLDGTGITNRFDTAFLHELPLTECGRGNGSFVARSLWTTPEDDYGVGSSFSVEGGAEVVLEARWGVGDAGVAGGETTLLGNRHYDNGDRLGNLPVVARSELGQGVVWCVGDGTSFVDSSVPFAHEFVRALCADAVHARRVVSASAEGWIVVAALLLIAAPCLRGRALAAFVAAVPLAGDLAAWSHGEPLPIVRWDRAVVVDGSPDPLTAAWSRDPARSVKGFCHQASAAGLTALVERDPRSAASDRPRHRVLIAPSRGPDQESIRDLTSYVEGGGTLWLVAGYEQAAPLASLSRALGAEILPAPLGGSGVDSGAGADSIARQAAWAVKTEEPATTLASACGFPFAATLTRGQGRVVVVGDSYFLCDQNLEGGRTEVAPNVALVGRLLGDGER